MSDDLYTLLHTALADKIVADIPVCAIESIAGEDWLMEVSEQARKMGIDIDAHPKDSLLAIITRL